MFSIGNKIFYIKTHRTNLVTGTATNAVITFCFDLQLWQMKQSSKLIAHYHKRSHPADVVAVGPLSVNDCRNQKQNYNSIIYYITVNV